MGEVDRPGILILQLFQAAARAAVAQALPFGVGHFLQRLGFPEKSVLVGLSLGRRGHLVRCSMGCSRSPSRCWGGETAILTPKPAPLGAKNPFILRMKS